MKEIDALVESYICEGDRPNLRVHGSPPAKVRRLAQKIFKLTGGLGGHSDTVQAGEASDEYTGDRYEGVWEIWIQRYHPPAKAFEASFWFDEAKGKWFDRMAISGSGYKLSKPIGEKAILSAAEDVFYETSQWHKTGPYYK